MTNPYKRGAALEYLMKNRLEKEGWFVVRSAGSHGVADLVAIWFQEGRHYVRLISCKVGEYAAPAERNALQSAAVKIGAVAMITVRGKGSRWELRPL